MREADIRPDHILKEYLRLSALDARTFFSDPESRIGRPCPGCGSKRFAPAFEKHGFAIVTCTACDSLYVDPAPTEGDLNELYRDSPSSRYWANVFFPSVVDARRPLIFRPRAERVLTLAKAQGVEISRLTDVGAGPGVFLEEFAKLSPRTDLLAVEPGGELASRLRGLGFAIFEGFADEAANAGLPVSDVVTCFEVIEHVLDPKAFLVALGKLARPGGLVVFSGLCGDGFDIKMLGQRSQSVSPPHHLNFMSQAGIHALVEAAGLILREFSTPGQLDVEIVVKALRQDATAVAAADVRNFLLRATADDCANFQKQLVAENRSSHMWVVARRPPKTLHNGGGE